MNFASKNYFAFVFILVFSGCFFESKTHEKVEFVSKQGTVNPLIFKLLKWTGILYTDGTLASVVDETQKHWMRKPGSERWDVVDISSDYQKELYTICKELSLFSEIKPEHQEYEYAFVLGALFQRMKLRFEYLVHLWNQGVRFNSIVFLSGSRPINQAQGENQDELEKWTNIKIQNMPQTETELLQFIYDHIVMPEEMRKLPVYIIDVPMLKNTDGTVRRPTTPDTVEWWLKTDPKPGKVLAVSSQPYVWYQDSVLQTLLSSTFEVDTVGQACLDDPKIGVLLDTLARILYQEKIRLEK